MPTDPTNLIGKVYDLLSGLDPATSGNQAFLAFETLGLPISDEMFKLNPTDAAPLPALAVERLSEIANKVPLVRGSTIDWSMATFDGTVDLLLEASEPAGTADAAQVLGAMKRQIHTEFDSTLGSLSGVPGDRFHPAYADPVDWYAGSAAANWTLHTIGDDPAPPPPRRIPIDPPRWRVLPPQTQPALSHPVTMSHPFLMAAQPVARSAPLAPAALSTSSAAVRFVAQPQALAAAAAVHPAAPISTATLTASGSQAGSHLAAAPSPLIQPLHLTEATQLVAANTTSHPVTSQNIGITFEHCVVVLRRPWWPDAMLMLRNWYVAGYARGDISNGNGSSDAGLMPVVTTGFVVIRNLRIVAQWSAQDQAAAQASASFGPFSLIGRSYDSTTGTLSCPGMQIIGWFCAALPILPPLSDPSVPQPNDPSVPKPTT